MEWGVCGSFRKGGLEGFLEELTFHLTPEDEKQLAMKNLEK